MQKLFPCGSLLLLHKQDTCSLFLFIFFFSLSFLGDQLEDIGYCSTTEVR